MQTDSNFMTLGEKPDTLLKPPKVSKLYDRESMQNFERNSSGGENSDDENVVDEDAKTS